MTVITRPRVPVPSRPYAKVRGSEPSVTTIVGAALDKPGLSYGAAKETALYAVLHRDKWAELPDADAIDKLRRHFRGIWDGRAAFGTLCHRVAEHFAAGEEVDVDRLVAWTMEHDRNARTWKERDHDDLVETALGYVLGIEAWWQDFQPEVICAETVVRTPGKYIGTTDLRCRIRGYEWLLDWKSTAQQDEGKGIYVESWLPQLSAYAWATETVEYEAWQDDNGRVKVAETGTGPWSPPDRLGVVHLRGDENYSFFELPLDKAHHDAFLAMAELVTWRKGLPEVPDVVKGEEQ